MLRVTLTADSLLADLQTAARIASSRSAVQALSGVLVSAAGDYLELQATDMEVSLRVRLSASVEEPGEVVLPARLLLDIVRSLPGASVTLAERSDHHDVEIASGNAVFAVRTLRRDDFPRLPEPPTGGVQLAAQAFVDTIARVARSASRDDTRPVLTGIMVHASGGELRMVATDSYRLSVKTTALDEAVSDSFEANVPARALQELSRIVAQSEADHVTIGRLENQVVFAVHGAGGPATISSRLIDGQFPSYQQLLPESVEHELRVDREELVSVTRRISLLAQKNAPLRLAFAEGQLQVSAQTPDIGEAHETLPVPFHGEAFEIGFNPEFFRDGLESVDSPEVLLRLTSPLRPGLIESADESGFVYLVMPIRLGT